MLTIGIEPVSPSGPPPSGSDAGAAAPENVSDGGGALRAGGGGGIGGGGALPAGLITPDPNKACAQCKQWAPPKSEGSCGGCKLLGGPIHPQGTCKAFAPNG